MSMAKYEDDCKGCRPAAIDLKTNEVMPPDHPVSLGMAVAWEKADRRTRVAWHAVTCQNSRRPHYQRLATAFRASMMREIQQAENKAGSWLMKN